ncbi:hypothetical protein HELRODRAFT_162572 [Helobdella robusta]|uniref:Uncharacterized protein n=1 Tax=Helobdella robusta TaxID=6412 RepID=T1ESU7_HELRO|nr:hypothetical protein HELRODRAFT_162572 [Helobdella robusta]ESN99085.1 hypothetical protein HELRODRAFT_162572 [Helobdella robusta]
MFTAGRILNSQKSCTSLRRATASTTGGGGGGGLTSPLILSSPSSISRRNRSTKINIDNINKYRCFVPFVWQAFIISIFGCLVLILGVALCIVGFYAGFGKNEDESYNESRALNQVDDVEGNENDNLDFFTLVTHSDSSGKQSTQQNYYDTNFDDNATNDANYVHSEPTHFTRYFTSNNYTATSSLKSLPNESDSGSSGRYLMKYFSYIGPVIMSVGSFSLVFACVLVCETRDKVLKKLQVEAIKERKLTMKKSLVRRESVQQFIEYNETNHNNNNNNNDDDDIFDDPNNNIDNVCSSNNNAINTSKRNKQKRANYAGNAEGDDLTNEIVFKKSKLKCLYYPMRRLSLSMLGDNELVIKLEDDDEDGDADDDDVHGKNALSTSDKKEKRNHKNVMNKIKAVSTFINKSIHNSNENKNKHSDKDCSNKKHGKDNNYNKIKSRNKSSQKISNISSIEDSCNVNQAAISTISNNNHQPDNFFDGIYDIGHVHTDYCGLDRSCNSNNLDKRISINNNNNVNNDIFNQQLHSACRSKARVHDWSQEIDLERHVFKDIMLSSVHHNNRGQRLSNNNNVHTSLNNSTVNIITTNSNINKGNIDNNYNNNRGITSHLHLSDDHGCVESFERNIQVGCRTACSDANYSSNILKTSTATTTLNTLLLLTTSTISTQTTTPSNSTTVLNRAATTEVVLQETVTPAITKLNTTHRPINNNKSVSNRKATTINRCILINISNDISSNCNNIVRNIYKCIVNNIHKIINIYYILCNNNNNKAAPNNNNNHDNNKKRFPPQRYDVIIRKKELERGGHKNSVTTSGGFAILKLRRFSDVFV